MNNNDLLPLLQCPYTYDEIQLNDGQIAAVNGITSYPVVKGVPVFIPNPQAVKLNSDDHLSNQLSPEHFAFVEQIQGTVLNLSAGGSLTKPKNVVELEYSIFRNTDVVGDAHRLPFKDSVFAGCICMNAFEHYKCPPLVMKEIHRVLKPGGRLYLHTAGLQPLHEPPYHFYNVTKFGLQEWLKDFEIQEIKVSSNFNPLFSLSWIASQIVNDIAASSGAQMNQVLNLTVQELVQFWRDPNFRGDSRWAAFKAMPLELQENCAAGWEALAVKR